jgi:serine/threonine protein kinase
MLAVGDQLGAYTLAKFLGRGQFGEVWLAEKSVSFSSRRFRHALKFLANDEEKINLAAAEAEIDTWIEASGHPNVMPVIDMFVDENYVVIISEYAEAGSMRHWMEQAKKGKRNHFQTLEMMAGILRGLEHLHSRNVIHRDLKPDNVLVQGNSPRITDFGISRILSGTLTATSVVGSPIYMAPEAFLGEKSPQTDIWSAGVILYELLTNSYPFDGETIFEVRDSVQLKEAPPLPFEIPEKIRSVVDRALKKNASERFPTAQKMRREIERASRTLAIEATNEALTVSCPDELAQTVPFEDITERIPIGVSDEVRETRTDSIFAVRTQAVAAERMVREDPAESRIERAIRFKPSSIRYMAAAIAIGTFLLVGIVVLNLAGQFDNSNNATDDLSPAVSPAPYPSTPDVYEMVAIPGGLFTMGRNVEPYEYGEHNVQVAPFFIGKTEVSNQQFLEFVNATGHAAPANWSRGKPIAGSEFCPVTFVSLDDAIAYAKWYSALNGGHNYRLPTEQEWEYVARNGARHNLYPWGNDWIEGNAVMGRADAEPANVGSKPQGANIWGILDLIGNVYEWTSSEYYRYPGSESKIPLNPKLENELKKKMVVRGGGVDDDPGRQKITSTYRAFVSRDTKNKVLGFRLARFQSVGEK